jgi:flagellar hook-length control protein FliK
VPAQALASNGDTQQDQAAPAADRSAVTVPVAAPAPGATPRTADTVTLSGPPTAWRQTLQEALGERMQLQVGKNAEQAVIRLEPPMLGRVEIAIRHSAGSLEVHITATHGEVLRQLQSVSEGLRNDLAQRQFSDVSVNIAPAPRAANGAPMFAGGEGRGRQQDGRQQEQGPVPGPGQALAEANLGTSPFSLNGRS